MEDEKDTLIPEVGDETQPAQLDTNEEVSNAPAQSEADTEKKLYAGKFKSSEALEEGYRNLETLLGQKSQQPVQNPVTDMYQEPPVNDLTALADENGNIDPMKLAEHMENRAVERIRKENRANEYEKSDWAEAVKEFPELSENPKLAEIVRTQRLNRLISGQGYMPYKDMAKEIVGMFDKKEQTGIAKGREEAQVSEKIVSRASMVEPSGSQDTGSNEKDELQKLMSSNDHEVARKARVEYLSKYM